MANIPLNELKLIAEYMDISDYENKSKEDLINHSVKQNQRQKQKKHQNQKNQNQNQN